MILLKYWREDNNSNQLMENKKFKTSKKSQSELITTVLLILISIAAVVLVSSFVMNMVRDNLGSTDCFKTTGQININVEDGFTYWQATKNVTVINIERGAKDFNLTGFLVSLGNEQSSKTYTIKAGEINAQIKMYSSSTANLTVPGVLGAETYNISTGADRITKIKVLPILAPDKRCDEGAAEAIVPAR